MFKSQSEKYQELPLVKKVHVTKRVTLIVLNSILKKEMKALTPVGNKTDVHDTGLFLSKHNVMADRPVPFYRSCHQRGAPVCGWLRMGWWECWELGDGGCPLNLLIAL